MSNFWELATASVAGLAALLAALVKLVPAVRSAYLALGDRFRKTEETVTAMREYKASLQAMRRVAAVEAVGRQWVAKKGIQRFLLLAANNGGEAWKGTGPLYVNCPGQAPGPGEPDTRDLWSQWKADGWYVDFLGRLLETMERRRGMLLVSANDVHGELLEQYKAQGTVASVVLPYHWEPGGILWYVSLNFGRNPTHGKEMTAEESAQHLGRAREIYETPAKCRVLIDQLRETHRSR